MSEWNLTIGTFLTNSLNSTLFNFSMSFLSDPKLIAAFVVLLGAGHPWVFAASLLTTSKKRWKTMFTVC